RPAQNQIVVRVDPLAIGELVEQSAVEAAWGPVIDVLDAGLLAQSGIAQPGGKPLVAAMGELSIDQQPEPVGMIERGGFVGGLELGKGLGHAGERTNRTMPRQARKPCSGCGRRSRISSQSAAVAGPIEAASRRMRSTVQSVNPSLVNCAP